MEEFTELSKATLLVSMVSYSERIKISQGRGAQGRVQESSKQRAIHCPLPVELCGKHLLLQETMYDNLHTVLSPMESH